MKFEYSWLDGPMARCASDLLKECSDLYSSHYGVWSQESTTPGKRVRLSPYRIAELLVPDDSVIHWARLDKILIGYAIAIRTKVPRFGIISWVTQLVVHESYRNNDVAKTLLFSIWGFSDHFAWGVVSANPYGVRALEKATRRRCVPTRISKHKSLIYRIAKHKIPYIREDTKILANIKTAQINTNFYVDHSQVNEMVKKVASQDIPWLLGPLEEGWEWLAFTFRDQQQISLTAQEIKMMLNASDQGTKQAYSRMQINQNQKWTNYAAKEAAEIIQFCGLFQKQTILDIGCGIGRHAITLARLGFKVTGVDYIEDFIAKAQTDAERSGLTNIAFLIADARQIDLGKKYDAVICLYDVVGTYADNSENIKILKKIVKHLDINGKAMISVMNYGLTEKQAKYKFSIEKEPDKLLDLAASQTMEETGDVFNPDYYMIDRDTRVVYRKEQFFPLSYLSWKS